MNRSILISSVLHLILIMITAMSLPFLAKKPIDHQCNLALSNSFGFGGTNTALLFKSY